MQRPKHLPEFRSPPLDEVVLGVQFAPVSGYSTIHAGQVWELFRNEFPIVQEQSPLAPAFETFGLPQVGTISFGFSPTPPHMRYWFVSQSNEHLIQFQNDRLLHNWRKVGDRTNDYPRFEAVLEKFRTELSILEKYFSFFKAGALCITQCELSYVNKIQVISGGKPQNLLRFLPPNGIDFDDFNIVSRRALIEDNGSPWGRLICEASSTIDTHGQAGVALSLTTRGAPKTPDIRGALDFLGRGREVICTSFAAVTTDSAHQKWERV